MKLINKTKTVIDNWSSIKASDAPELKEITINSKNTAPLVLDIQKNNCNKETRPRCVECLYTAWHIINAPRTKRNATLTKADLIKIK